MSPTHFTHEQQQLALERMNLAELAAMVKAMSELYDANNSGCDGQAETLRDQIATAVRAKLPELNP